MKPFRRRIGRRRRNINLVSMILIFVVLPLTAIYIGLRVTENWVFPVLNQGDSDFNFLLDPEEAPPEGEEEETIVWEETENPEEPSDDPPGEETAVRSEVFLQNLDVYAIQVASLADTSNIDAMIRQLNEHQLAYLVYKTETGYKVFVNGSTDRALLESRLPVVRQVFPEAFIQQLPLTKPEIIYTAENESQLELITGHLDDLIQVLTVQGEEWYENYQASGDLTGYKNLLLEQQSLLSQITTLVNGSGEAAGGFNKEQLESLISYQNSNVDRAIEIIEAGQPDTYYQLHSLYLDSLFRVVELVNKG